MAVMVLFNSICIVVLSQKEQEWSSSTQHYSTDDWREGKNVCVFAVYNLFKDWPG